MKLFKSLSGLQQLDPSSPSAAFIEPYLTQMIAAYSEEGRVYEPEHDGYMVLVEQGDAARVFDDLSLPHCLINIPWEGISLEQGHFYALYMANNQFGIGFVIPDADWLPISVRQALIEGLDP